MEVIDAETKPLDGRKSGTGNQDHNLPQGLTNPGSTSAMTREDLPIVESAVIT